MLDRTVPPIARAISDITIPIPQYTTIGRNYPALLVPDTNQPVISMEIIFQSGKWHERDYGTSFYAAKMIAEGTSRLSSEEIARKFDSAGSFLEIVPGIDRIAFKLHTLKRFFQSSVKLLFELFAEASFPKEQYEIMQQFRQQSIKSQLSKNNHFANLKIAQQLFGEVHPYGRQLAPEEALQVTLQQVRAFYETSLAAKPNFVIIGDFEDQLDLIDQLAHELKTVQPTQTSSGITTGTDKLLEERPDSSQASIRLGAMSINNSHEDIHAYTITQMLLGGYFGSRLMKNIREDKGLTYGISSQIVHLERASYWVIGSEVKRENVDLAISEINKEIDDLQQHRVSAEELDLLKNYAKGKMLSSFDSSFSLARVYKSQFLSGLPNDFLKNYLIVLDNISPSEIRSMAQKYLRPDHQVVIA